LSGIEISVSHNEGWNLVGLPLEVESNFYQDLFPGSVSGTLYGFNGTYTSESELTPGAGYWINFPDADSAIISGISISNMIISLDQGWNLISGISEVVDIASISDPGGIIVPGTVYGFTGTYSSASGLAPGQGYWINASADGDVTISSVTARAITSFTDRTKEANMLSFNGVELYFGVSIPGEEMASYQLPPSPPSGAFDVRFKDGWRLVNSYGEIEVMPISETLTIAYDIQVDVGNQYNWILTSENDEGHTLEKTGEIVVPSTDRFTLKRELVLPETFGLYQNYPNPFNPITTLRYDLPEQAFVTLTIYDMLGREIVQLVNTTKEAGIKVVQWDSTDNMGNPVSAGVYLYQIQAGEFVQTKKMVLLK